MVKISCLKLVKVMKTHTNQHTAFFSYDNGDVTVLKLQATYPRHVSASSPEEMDRNDFSLFVI